LEVRLLKLSLREQQQYAPQVAACGESWTRVEISETGLLMSPSTKAFAATNSINKSWKSELVDCHSGTGHSMMKTARLFMKRFAWNIAAVATK
jgi:hypothetical protein